MPDTPAVPLPEPDFPAMREPLTAGLRFMYTERNLLAYAAACAEQARREERERCALLCEDIAKRLDAFPPDSHCSGVADQCADAIRALGES